MLGKDFLSVDITWTGKHSAMYPVAKLVAAMTTSLSSLVNCVREVTPGTCTVAATRLRNASSVSVGTARASGRGLSTPKPLTRHISLHSGAVCAKGAVDVSDIVEDNQSQQNHARLRFRWHQMTLRCLGRRAPEGLA